MASDALEAGASVVRTSGSVAWVRAERPAGCGRCAEVGGCASQRLSRLLGGAPRTIRVENSFGARSGERVTLSIPEGAMAGASLAAYGIPLLALLAGAVAGGAIAPGAHADLAAAGGAAAGLLAGLGLARGYGQWRAAGLMPRIVAAGNPSPSVSCQPSKES